MKDTKNMSLELNEKILIIELWSLQFCSCTKCKYIIIYIEEKYESI